LMESILRDCGSSGRTYKSALIFAVPDAAQAVHDAARNALAWEDIHDDEDTIKRIDEGQKSLLARNLKNAQRDLDEAIFRTYRHVYLLGKDNKLRHIDLGQITSSSAASLVELIVHELDRCDEMTTSVSPSKLVKYWPSALVEWSTKAVRDAFYSSPLLPRLANGDAVKRAICDGVTAGTLGYASKDSAGRLKLEKLKQSLLDAEVEISDEMFILKADDAQKLLELPRLAGLLVRPASAMLKLGEQASFSCAGIDQYGQPFAVPSVKWTATGGTVTADGLFTAGDTGGLYTVRAESAGVEALAEVRITTKDETTPHGATDGAPPARERMIRWRGTVPTQKWMNFYTKVLTRFASTPGLKVEVSFEVPADGEQGKAKAEEARGGLRELGLDDGVRVE
ncbi:MAG TPA: hypothetical protein VGX78_13550, partial [Pirellulales bacterium]|nr:hypothetical protein [Pirellulales bacterium]